LLCGRHPDTTRPMLGAVCQDLGDNRTISKPENVVEVLNRVLRVTPGVGPTENCDGASGLEQIAQRVCELSGLGERTNEDEVDIIRQFLDQVFEPGIAHECYVVSFLLAPGCDDL